MEIKSEKLYRVRTPKAAKGDKSPLTIADFITEVELVGETPQMWIIKEDGKTIKEKKRIAKYEYFQSYKIAVDNLRVRLLLTLSVNEGQISRLKMLQAIYEKLLKEADEINGIPTNGKRPSEDDDE